MLFIFHHLLRLRLVHCTCHCAKRHGAWYTATQSRCTEVRCTPPTTQTIAPEHSIPLGHCALCGTSLLGIPPAAPRPPMSLPTPPVLLSGHTNTAHAAPSDGMPSVRRSRLHALGRPQMLLGLHFHSLHANSGFSPLTLTRVRPHCPMVARLHASVVESW